MCKTRGYSWTRVVFVYTKIKFLEKNGTCKCNDFFVVVVFRLQ